MTDSLKINGLRDTDVAADVTAEGVVAKTAKATNGERHQQIVE